MAGNPGLDRAGYKQISHNVEAIFVGPTTGSTAETTALTKNGYACIKVISSRAVFASITAPGLTNSSKITSATSFLQNAEIECNQITAFKLSCDTTGHMVTAFNKVLL